MHFSFIRIVVHFVNWQSSCDDDETLIISSEKGLHHREMRRVLGILTEDFRLYHDLVAILKTRDISFVSLSFSQKMPANVGAIMTSEAESSKIRFANKVECGNIEESIVKALQMMKGKTGWREIIIGIDPGEKPGFAVVGDGDVLDARNIESPETVAVAVSAAVSGFPAEKHRVRIGHGDATNRNRIINALEDLDLRIDIVDEKGTTRRTEHPDIDAAIRIAQTPGVRAFKHYEIKPTRGEVREIQRRSRLTSNGELTISASLAASVARGEMSLGEAVGIQRRKK